MKAAIQFLADRFLHIFAPRAEARAGEICNYDALCIFCGYQGSMQTYKFCITRTNCVTTCSPCLINNPQC
jgi:hypothetical protein